MYREDRGWPFFNSMKARAVFEAFFGVWAQFASAELGLLEMKEPR
jgi:hypothetical protein